VNKADFKSTIIFSDGACTGNPGPGGWASVVTSPDGKVLELGGGSPETTNNRMEMMGALMGLRALPAPYPYPVVIYTDSTYVIRGITEWIWAWRSRGWKNAEGKDVSNRDLWEELSRELLRLKPTTVDWKYVRGHTGVPGNERCDEISVAYANGKWVKLYRGPLLQYDVAIYDLPEDEGLPEMRPREKKAPAFSYLSYHGGVVRRHAAWASCERRVKGQSGAKFKKAMSQADEAEILKGWGLNVKTPVVDD
jgi:ribonuclease HI